MGAEALSPPCEMAPQDAGLAPTLDRTSPGYRPGF